MTRSAAETPTVEKRAETEGTAVREGLRWSLAHRRCPSRYLHKALARHLTLACTPPEWNEWAAERPNMRSKGSGSGYGLLKAFHRAT